MENVNKTSNCLRIGITGGIGSGKSTVCKIFESLGIPIYDADYWAKWLIANDKKIISGIQSIFGTEAYLPDGAYNRPFISKIVFENPEKLAQLNQLVHPAVERHSVGWHKKWAKKHKPYTLKEAALMVESGSHRHLDKLIVVAAPEDLRIQRVMQRDGLTQEQVRARLKNQWAEEEKVKLADFVVINDGEHALIPQIVAIHRQLLSLSPSK